MASTLVSTAYSFRNSVCHVIRYLAAVPRYPAVVARLEVITYVILFEFIYKLG